MRTLHRVPNPGCISSFSPWSLVGEEGVQVSAQILSACFYMPRSELQGAQTWVICQCALGCFDNSSGPGWRLPYGSGFSRSPAEGAGSQHNPPLFQVLLVLSDKRCADTAPTFFPAPAENTDLAGL